MVLNRLKNKITLGNPKNESSEALANGEDFDEIDTENQSILMGIISQLRPGCDLTRITLPTFILEKKSMLERITNAFFTPQIVLEANATDDDVERFLLIVKWYLSGWHIAPKAVKKPLNPVLGEIFSCYWTDLPEDCSAYYLAEQTSHHPPESSYFYLLPEKKIKVDGVVIPRSKFLGNSSAAMMEGVAHVTLGEHDDEIYTMTQPNAYCRGILFGKLRYELGDHMLITCEKNHLKADIEFKTKGFISGSYDAIEGVVTDTRTSKTLFTISGKWNGKMEIQSGTDGKKELFYDTSTAEVFRPQVKPFEDQLPNESRKLWHKTLMALDERNHEKATDEKMKVEEDQRLQAKERSEKGHHYEPSYFVRTGSGDIPFLIGADINVSVDQPDEMVQKLFKLHEVIPQESV